ncbi:Txe/YoeB family addiction module toxin [Vibrio splendidus]|uniref:Txe/YoeB family addiction module toxin n=1 Tax=Vibrio splendidus TaxID=29497 RepID=UPI000C84BCBE|nr:Txe/YoeB family addiction module toxin [Vibrio splendidus]
MNLLFSPHAWDDYLYWQKQDKKVIKRINRLIEDSTRQPTSGIGKPEALKENLSGYWSRRITDEHRLVYSFSEETLTIVSLRYHYSK